VVYAAANMPKTSLVHGSTNPTQSSPLWSLAQRAGRVRAVFTLSDRRLSEAAFNLIQCRSANAAVPMRCHANPVLQGLHP